ncbi:MAG: hypothetical protein HYX65_00530 [Gemmatimonadetes bacterium]|nr:hypothetical protein [Gemmatimonadota bacterium]
MADDAVALVAREDSWLLGGLDGTAFAPAAPRWLDAPGFWDGGAIGDAALAPLFTVSVLDADGFALPLKVVARRATPAELTAEYRLPNGITATEVRSVHPGGVFVSEWRLRSLKRADVHLVAWTLQPVSQLDPERTAWTGALDFVRRVGRRATGRRQGDAARAELPGEGSAAPVRLQLSLACLGATTSWAALPATDADQSPRWEQAPLAEVWTNHRLPGAMRPADGHRWWCGAVHRALGVGDGGGAVTFAMRLSRDGAPALAAPAADLGATLGGVSRRRWQERLGAAPRVSSSDPFIEAAWSARWESLWAHAVTLDDPERTLAIREHTTGAVSARATPAVLRELAWSEPVRARALLAAWMRALRADGSLPRALMRGGRDHPPSALTANADPADWGAAAAALHAIAPDTPWLAATHGPLGRHAEWMATRGEEEAGSRDGADRAVAWNSWTYRLARWLEDTADAAGVPEQAGRWRETAARAGAGIARALGHAPLLQGGHPSAAPSALPLLALGTDVPTRDQVTALLRALHDPARFWTPFPVPARALGDSEALWRAAAPLGDRDEPSAARMVPWISCAIADALLGEIDERPELRRSVALIVARLVRVRFADGDLRRLRAAGDHNPLTGQASAALGAQGDQREWPCDLLLRAAAGIRPHAAGITVDPLPVGADRLDVTGVQVRGRTLDVHVAGERVRVVVDGAEREGPLGEPIEVSDAGRANLALA